MLDQKKLKTFNEEQLPRHKTNFDHLGESLTQKGLDIEAVVDQIGAFQIAIPSWALGTGGTRFGRFPKGGEPSTLEEKIKDVGILHTLNRSSGAISLHIPWDIPKDYKAIKNLANRLDIVFDAVNSNTFQDQPESLHSYKFGSLSHIDTAVRKEAIRHNKEVIDHGIELGSKALTVWLADGTSFAGQHDFRGAFQRSLESLEEIYDYLPSDWKLLIEYKPYEPNFYSMVIPDWGTSHLLASKLGDQATTLVDLGHHLPNTNIEQIVALLMHLNKLGGFHFNDSKYGDDDLTVGSIKPYQLFLIFCELVKGMRETANPELSWMIDASHNLKDPMEDLLQSVESIKIAYARALLVNYDGLKVAQSQNDVAAAQSILQEAFRTDVRPLVKESIYRKGGALDALEAYRSFDIRNQLIRKRGRNSKSTGL
ncbi:MAG: TIM barrel protein [Flavobacteriaceae bacterium]